MPFAEQWEENTRTVNRSRLYTCAMPGLGRGEQRSAQLQTLLDREKARDAIFKQLQARPAADPPPLRVLRLALPGWGGGRQAAREWARKWALAPEAVAAPLERGRPVV